VIVRVYYHSIHSVLPREALKVEIADARVFGTFEEAAGQARDMMVGGEYSYAPMLLDRQVGGQGAADRS
jgi:hypothetical protein